MAKIKITKQDLKEDQVLHWGESLMNKIQENKNQIIIVLVIIAALFIINKGYKYKQEQTRKQTNSLYRDVLDSYFISMNITDPEKKGDRDKKLAETITKADNLIKAFPGQPLARASMMIKGSVLYYQDKFDEAVTVYQNLLNAANSDYEKAEALLGLGYTFENKHFKQQNIEALKESEKYYDEAIAKGKGSEIATEAKLCKARILEQMKENEKALKLYEEVLEASKKNEKPAEQSPFTTQGMESYLFNRYNEFNTMFSFGKDAEMAIERIKGATPAL